MSIRTATIKTTIVIEGEVFNETKIMITSDAFTATGEKDGEGFAFTTTAPNTLTAFAGVAEFLNVSVEGLVHAILGRSIAASAAN